METFSSTPGLPPIPVEIVSRVQPKLIRIDPPLIHPRDLLAMSILPGATFVLMAVALYLLDEPRPGVPAGPSTMWQASLALTALGVVVASIVGGGGWLLNRRRAAYLREQTDRERDLDIPDPPYIVESRRNHDLTPHQELRQIVMNFITTENPARPWVVASGMVRMPVIDTRSFQPEIIAPGRGIWDAAAMGSLLVVGIFALAWLVPAISPWPIFTDRGGMMLLVTCLFAAPLVIRWLWRCYIRPRYIRLAPGIVQFIEYGLFRRKPKIESFPIRPGTLVIMENRAYRDVTLTIYRDKKGHTIDLSGLRDAPRAIEMCWHALLSPAPTPPLDETELVG